LAVVDRARVALLCSERGAMANRRHDRHVLDLADIYMVMMLRCGPIRRHREASIRPSITMVAPS